ncbi:unnamed protein product [Gadus morhua 'NCC']
MADWGRGHGAVDDILDAENKLLAENLASKVSRLKSLAYDIDKDAEDQNMYIDGMDSDFLSATGLLTGSVKRFSTMLRSSRDNRKIMCYMSGGLVALFFLLYYLSRPRPTPHKPDPNPDPVPQAVTLYPKPSPGTQTPNPVPKAQTRSPDLAPQSRPPYP